MQSHTSLILAAIIMLIFGCDSDQEITHPDLINERKFTEVKKLSEYESTEFIPTLEHKLNDKKNAVYCVTLLYAWDEIKKAIKVPMEIPNEHFDLTLLHESTTYQDVLKSDEYKAIGEVDGDTITARAEFNKSLPFETKLRSFAHKLVFDGKNVSSFGVTGYSDFDQIQTIQILYYKNDDNFIIKLLPKDTEHEIVLFKSENKFSTMSKMNEEIERLSEIGKKEKDKEHLSWKYNIADEDEVVIPKFNFNIETNYKTIEGNRVKTKSKNYLILTAWQRTAFMLDESGAEIESEAEMEVAVEITDEDPEQPEKPKPKKMILDKPFLLLLKREESNYPYFGLWSVNSELMMKENKFR